jgi:uncharacterized protein YraI
MYIHIYVMRRFWFNSARLIFGGSVLAALLLHSPNQVPARVDAQSQVVATITYSEPINVRGGPSTVYYPIVGRLNPGDIVPALGVSPGREWVQIAYPDAPGGVGWVYATFVSISGGELQIVEPPPTSTPIATATINPTFAAAFQFQTTPTRLPTFTPPAPVATLEFLDPVSNRRAGMPTGIILISFVLIGALVYLVTLFLRDR